MDPLAALGQAGLIAAAVFLILTSISPLLSSRFNLSWRANALGAFLALLFSSAVLQAALLSHDYRLAYVVDANSRDAGLIYQIAGMWGASQGSLLLWDLCLSLWLAAASRIKAPEYERQLRATSSTLAASNLIFLGVTVLIANPFALLSHRAATGVGPSALLQTNPLVAIHPVLLYLGLTGMVALLCQVTGCLLSSCQISPYLVRINLLPAWGFLSCGILLGALWSYQVLGWGGFWAWDPVENASLIPWLFATASLHVVASRRAPLFSTWGTFLTGGAGAAAVVATYLTRSGAVESVHSFARSNLASVLLGITALHVGVFLAELFRTAGSHRARERARTWREVALSIQASLSALSAALVLIGTFSYILPGFSGIEVGPPFYEEVLTPLFLVALAVMVLTESHPRRILEDKKIGISAFLAAIVSLASRLSGLKNPLDLLALFLASFLAFSVLASVATTVGRGRSRLPQRLAHMGIAAAAVGVVLSSSLSQTAQVTLKPGKPQTVLGRRLELTGFSLTSYPTHILYRARIEVGSELKTVSAEYFPYQDAGVGIPTILHEPAGDFYLAPMQIPGPKSPLQLKVTTKPFIWLVWGGGGLVVASAAFLVAFELNKRRKSIEMFGVPAERAEEVLSGAALGA